MERKNELQDEMKALDWLIANTCGEKVIAPIVKGRRNYKRKTCLSCQKKFKPCGGMQVRCTPCGVDYRKKYMEVKNKNRSASNLPPLLDPVHLSDGVVKNSKF